MNCVIPYTKEIVFKTKIGEISSISLEHEMNISNGELLGNFIVSGEYKAHELSVNKEEFSYTLPFSIDLSENVDEDSVEFSITDFSYEVINENTLNVFIEFRVIASEKETLEEDNSEEAIFVDAREALDEVIELPEILKEENIEEIKDIETEEKVVIVPEENEEDRENISDISKETIMSSLKDDVDSYATYHIHIVKEAENIEVISSLYNSNADLINEYNDLSNVAPGDKLIIPEDTNE